VKSCWHCSYIGIEQCSLEETEKAKMLGRIAIPVVKLLSHSDEDDCKPAFSTFSRRKRITPFTGLGTYPSIHPSFITSKRPLKTGDYPRPES